MNIYKVNFNPMYPVPSGLLILANNDIEAFELAKDVIKHDKPREIKLIKQDKPKVIFYESGDY